MEAQLASVGCREVPADITVATAWSLMSSAGEKRQGLTSLHLTHKSRPMHHDVGGVHEICCRRDVFFRTLKFRFHIIFPCHELLVFF